MSIRDYKISYTTAGAKNIEFILNKMDDKSGDVEYAILVEALRHKDDPFFQVECKSSNGERWLFTFNSDWFIIEEINDGESELQTSSLGVSVLSK